LSDVLKAIQKLKAKVEKVPTLVEESCANIALKAASDAPRDVTVSANANTVTASGPLAAYYEFGTGTDAAMYIPSTLPTHWDEYAYSFYKTGEGTLKHKPYLFPAYESERLELIKKIKQSFG
jgi:hypothetical protein